MHSSEKSEVRAGDLNLAPSVKKQRSKFWSNGVSLLTKSSNCASVIYIIATLLPPLSLHSSNPHEHWKCTQRNNEMLQWNKLKFNPFQNLCLEFRKSNDNGTLIKKFNPLKSSRSRQTDIVIFEKSRPIEHFHSYCSKFIKYTSVKSMVL